MVRGLEVFKTHFSACSDYYVLIGGTAATVLMEEAGLEFRATRDLDVVIMVEAVDALFVTTVWDFVKSGKYRLHEASSGEKRFYRFSKPGTAGYPAMLELFSRVPDTIVYEGEGHLTPIPADAEVSSLSAILLDDDYYSLVKNGVVIVDGLPVLKPEYLIPMKAKAYLDLSELKASGTHVDSKNIKKHQNDVFRLFQLMTPGAATPLSGSVKNDMTLFFRQLRNEEINLKSLGIEGIETGEIVQRLTESYGIDL
ncbi:MAG: hypothetical protein O3C43_24600 [Verrucomicrobia bacterium]|nr:hypothetical protein [Verrucomicrobiota bacterium]